MSLLYFTQRLLTVAFVSLTLFEIQLNAQTPPLVSGNIGSSSSADPSAQSRRVRYKVVTRETATFYVGKQAKFDIVLVDPYGKQVDAPRDLETTITVTTLETLDEAKAWLASRKIFQKAPLVPLRRVTLPLGQQASQIRVIHRKDEEDETVYLLSNQTGPLHIFVESQDIETGETVVIVLKAKRTTSIGAQMSGPATSAVRMMPIKFQAGPANQLKLDFHPKQSTIRTGQGDQIRNFRVVLQTATEEYEEASEEISVILDVVEGYAGFMPGTLKIPKGQAITPDVAELRTRPGGSITVRASTSRSHKITPVTRTYEFTPGVHSTSLSVQKQRDSAYSNGLDGIELKVEALQDGRAITPEEEGMEERKIFFHLKGDSHGVRFENGKSEITIPKGQQTGTIKLFSVRSVSDLEVVAESWNGLRNRINSQAPVPILFTFPWLPMLCALAGGLVFPLLARQDLRSRVQGLVVGAIFFGLALFGAVLSDPQSIGPVKVALTKLPTENAFASFILGFLGSLLLGVIFIGSKRYKSSK